MNRPASRPEKPLSPKEFLDAFTKHFVYDKAPRCSIEGLGCRYDGTGCAVGFLFTSEDARQADLKFGSISVKRTDQVDILSKYFDLSHPLMYVLLVMAQSLHDGYTGTPEDFTRSMLMALHTMDNVLMRCS